MRKFTILFFTLAILIVSQGVRAEFIPFSDGMTPESPVIMSHQSLDSALQISIDFPGVTTEAITEGGNEYTRMFLNKGGILGDIGDPQIPCVTYYFEVPRGVDILVETTALSEKTLTGNHIVYPNQERLPNQTDVFAINSNSYSLSTFLPAESVLISQDSILRGRRILQISVPVIRFNPTTQQAKGVASISFALNFSGTSNPEADYEKQRLYSESFETLCARIITNYEPVSPGGYNGEITGCDYLIITHDDLVPALTDFVSWKNKKGFLTQLVGLSNTESMSNTVIKDLIQTAYNSYPSPVYVLIVGDQNRILPFYGTKYSRTTPHDYDYSLMDGETDTLPDVFMARVPVYTLDECATVIGKQLEYEMTPIQNNCYRSMLFAGEYQDIEDPDCEEEDWLYELITRTMQYYTDNTTVNRYTAMYNGNYDPNDPQGNCEVYSFDTSDYPNRLPYPEGGVPPEWIALWKQKENAEVDIVNAYNSGIGCSIYSGHGLSDKWCEPKFSTSDVDSLTANQK